MPDLTAIGLTVPDLKLFIGKELAKDDALLGKLLESAWRQAQAPAPLGCGRVLYPDPAKDSDEPVARTYTIRGRHISIGDAREIDSVVVDGESQPPTVLEEDLGYSTFTRDGMVVRLTLHREHQYLWDLGGPWGGFGPDFNRPRRHKVTVTGRFGFVTLPEDLRDGIYALAARSFFQRQARYADQVALGEGMGVQQYTRALPLDTKMAFATYTLPTGLIGLA